MIRHVSELESNLQKFFEHHERYVAAVRARNVPAANRNLLKVSSYLDAIAASPKGKAMIENLMRDADPYLRLRAAGSVMSWMPEAAIQVFGKLLVDDLSYLSPDESLDIHHESKGWLYKHFNIRSFDQNDLIEPLKAYGVDLPFQDHTKWQ